MRKKLNAIAEELGFVVKAASLKATQIYIMSSF